MNLGNVVVSKTGILNDKKDECQALIGRIAVEIDLKLEMLECLEDIKMPNRQEPEYIRVFNKAARDIYRIITERSCPESARVF